jgi:hypothetical protein
MTPSELLATMSQDAIYAFSELAKKHDDPAERNQDFETLTDWISLIDSEFRRSDYIGQVCKILKLAKKTVANAVAAKINARVEKATENNDQAKLDTKFREDLEEHGFYEDRNCYWFLEGRGPTQGSNFVIEPLFHIYSKTDNKRLIRIKNTFGRESVLDLPSAAMVSPQKFQDVIFEEGNYLFMAGKPQFFRVLQKIGESFPVANEIKTLGWQPEGFWAFANGMLVDGTYKPIDEYGMVDHQERKYFLPAFSSIYSASRDGDDTYEIDRKFKFKNEAPVTFEIWARQMVRVFGNNGAVAIGWQLAGIFRDVVYDLYKYFPHLFLFGEKQSGKSAVAWRLSNLFFDGIPPFMLNAGTPVGFFRKLARTRNATAWFDEYADTIDVKRFQALKAAFDGAGHEKGVMSRDNRTEMTKVNSPLVISGQYLPTLDDNALFTRSILLSFSKKHTEYTQDEKLQYALLEHWESEGVSQVVAEILTLRKDFEKNFAKTKTEVDEALSVAIAGRKFETRIFNNYSVVTTAVKLAGEKLKLPFTYDEFFALAVFGIVDQSQQISESEGLATFWQTLEYLKQQNQIHVNIDFKIEGASAIMVNKNGVSEMVSFGSIKTLLHIRMVKIHPLYMKLHKEMFGTTGIRRESLRHYLQTNRAFIGNCDNTDFEDTRTSSFVFDYEKLPVRLHNEKIVEPFTPAQKEHSDVPF